MNGRLDHSIRYVLGVLALAAVTVGALAWSGPAKAALCDTRTDSQGSEYQCQAAYDGGLEAFEACEADAAQYGKGCTQSSGGPWSDDPEVSSIMVYSEPTDVTPGVNVIITYLYTPVCPGGAEADADGLCPSEPDCEHGEIQIGENAGQCRSDCGALGQDETDNYWGEGTTDGDYQNVEPGCDPATGCGVAPARFHRLVDGSLVTEWTHTGSACSAGSDPLGVGESETDGCVGSGFSEFCYEEGTQEGNCGTFNGERVCFDAIPEDGACTGGSIAGDSYTCGTQGDYSIIPELPDGLTADEQGAVTMIGGDAEATVTVSGGSVVEGDAPLDEPQTPTEGDPGAGDHDGTGDGEGEEEGFCDKAPHLCDDSKAEDLPDKDLPEDETDISDLVGPGDYPNVISAPAACPEPQTFALPDSMGGASIDMPYTAFCDFAVYINPLIVSLSYLAAFFIGLRILI